MDSIIKTVDDLKELASRIKHHTDPIAMDTETNGLFPMEDQITGWSLAFSETEGYYIPRKHRHSPNVPDFLHHQLFELLQEKELVWHNALFDLQMIKANFGLEMPVYSDTLIMAYLACFQELGLKKIISSMFHYDTKEFKELLASKYGTQWKSLGYTSADLDDIEISDYAIHDVLYTYKLFNMLKDEMKQYASIFKLELNLVPIVAQMNMSGINIATDKLKQMSDFAKESLKEPYAKMSAQWDLMVNQAVQNPQAPKGKYTLSSYYGVKFNPNSVLHIRAFMIEGMKMPILKRTEKGEISVDNDVLEQYADPDMKNPFAQELINYRKLTKFISQYLDKIPEICSHTDKLYASFKPTGTESGRFSSSGVKNWQDQDRTVNLQNQPKDDNAFNIIIRTAYVAPSGWTWVKADYKQQEYRVMCNIAGEQKAIQKFREGVDFHTTTARLLLEIPDDQEVTKEQRSLGKKLNFGLSYGMSLPTLAKNINRTEQETKILYDKYFLELSHVRDLVQWANRQVEQTEAIKTYFGRMRKLLWKDKGRQGNRIKESGFNSMIQGTAADITKIAMLRVKDRVLDKYDESIVKMQLQVHDELDFIVRDDMLDEVCAAIKNAMTIPTPDTWVDFEVDLEVGPSWSESEHKDWEGEFITDKFTGWGDIIPKHYQSYLTVPGYLAKW